MKLTTDKLGEVPEVDAAVLDEVLASDGFGNFAALSASDEEFIQAGNEWQPGAECEAFLAAHGSDPWVLEYHEDGRFHRAAGHVTLDQVRQAFRSYLAGGSEWRIGFWWTEVVLETTSPDGVVTTYRTDGSVLSEAMCVGDIRHGQYRDFWPHGGLSREGQYRDGRQEGEWRFYNPDGTFREVVWFEAGREIPTR
ncbi:MAG TPA: hypothetical protein VH092_31325 [Urbifossiella sp.]|jgi:hypothetical protein|nr:hypothetical protein [Urbifossiella sp.]